MLERFNTVIRYSPLFFVGTAQALLPPEPMDSVSRIPDAQNPYGLVADITLHKQKGHIRVTLGCMMEIGIVSERVAYYAARLFGVQVETKNGLLYLHYPGGSKVMPNTRIELQACHMRAELPQRSAGS